eukprot:scaffold5494_cov57-Phaeocystis_antarctica.AAC.1
MAVDGSAVNKSITVEQMMATVMNLTATDNEISTTRINITQDFTVDYDGDESSVDKLVEACQTISPSCVERVTGRRRALQSGSTSTGCGAGGNLPAGMKSTTFTRSLSDGNLTVEVVEIPNLKATDVSVSNSTLCSVNVQLLVTKQGGAGEADALLDGSLSTEKVRLAVSAGLGLDESALSVESSSIFPPMPPPSLPPSPPSLPPSPPPPLPPPPSPSPPPPSLPPSPPPPSPPPSPPPPSP